MEGSLKIALLNIKMNIAFLKSSYTMTQRLVVASSASLNQHWLGEKKVMAESNCLM